jgi:hypothetical protein
MGKLIDMIGQKYGRLTIVERAPNVETRANWHCVCDCGNKTTVTGKKLRNGHTKSCGCYRAEVSAKEQGHKNKLSIESVKDKLLQNGYELLSEYDRSDARAKMKCTTCSLIFERRIDSSLYNSSGCPSCSKALNGFIGTNYFQRNPEMKNKPCKLYLIEFTGNNEKFWKVGITRRSVERRISKIPYQSKILDVIEGTLFEIFEKEKKIKRENKTLRYRPQLKFNGHSECFRVSPNLT